jgi:hypothetical protein
LQYRTAAAGAQDLPCETKIVLQPGRTEPLPTSLWRFIARKILWKWRDFGGKTPINAGYKGDIDGNRSMMGY